MALLQIYDADDGVMKVTGSLRPADHSVGVTGGIKGLVRALDQLVAARMVFDRAVFHTHGNEGFIAFNGEVLDSLKMMQELSTNYGQLFPVWSRIYFNGCKVSAGLRGRQFLEAAGQKFLYLQGGEVFAHSDYGYPLVPYLPSFFSILAWGAPIGWWVAGAAFYKYRGKSFHPSRPDSVLIAPGGRAVQQSPSEASWSEKLWSEDDKRPSFRGMKNW